MSYTFIPGKSHPVGTEAETLSAVRSVLTEVEEEKPTVKRLFSKAKPVMRRSKAELFSPLADDEVAETPERVASLRSRMGFNEGFDASEKLRSLKLPATLKNMPKPKRKHVALGVLAALVLFRPFWVLTAVLVLVVLCGLAFVAIGGEKIWRGVMLALHQLSEKDPERAVRIRKRLDAFAMKWDMFLDRFPEGSVDHFYMPDFQVLSAEEARNEVRFASRMEEH